MTTLLDGTVVDESRDAVHFFTPDQCQQFYGRPRVVKYITIHHWGSLGQSFYDVVNFLCSRRDGNPTSAHAVIMAGMASSIISPDNAAFHSGSAVGNAESIGLECRPEATDEDYLTVASYIVYLRSIYGDLPLRKHSDWYATACPGVWDLDRLDSLARELAVKGYIAEELEDTEKMIILAKKEGATEIWAGDGVIRRHIPNPQSLNDLIWLGNNGFLKVADNGNVATVKDLNAIGKDIAEIPVDTVNSPVAWFGLDGKKPASGRSTTTLALQAGWQDSQVVSIQNGLKGVSSAAVALTDADLAKIVDQLQARLAPGLAAELAKRLSD